MSRTDKTRPRWVQISDEPIPVHDHRFEGCTLPDRITREKAGGCYWSGTAAFNCFRHDNGAREWYRMRREDRRRSRHKARRDLRAGRDES